MDNLQYTYNLIVKYKSLCFKPYYKWIIFNMDLGFKIEPDRPEF